MGVGQTSMMATFTMQRESDLSNVGRYMHSPTNSYRNTSRFEIGKQKPGAHENYSQ